MREELSWGREGTNAVQGEPPPAWPPSYRHVNAGRRPRLRARVEIRAGTEIAGGCDGGGGGEGESEGEGRGSGVRGKYTGPVRRGLSRLTET